jgi:molybdopterin-guanine dinucleotide biosynthesis adapter protein
MALDAQQSMRIIGLVGWSGAGKTTLIAGLIPLLIGRGLTVSTVKHAHHSFDVDQPGKDSYAHRQAGAREVLVASRRRYALIHEIAEARDIPLAVLLAKLSRVNLVIVEGFKRENHSKIEVHRVQNGKPFLFPADCSIRALISDSGPGATTRPHASIDDLEAVSELIWRYAEPIEMTLARLAASTAGKANRADGTVEQ